ncbi:Pacifastin inhibitor (LCMII) [Popillia japonica]|uniref:Pacifastin inhibitor (LCMII) n=1 Tax=Popillia japonica TaxID=7064 RepID=A0AAW1MAJ3_POPJA
MLSVKFAFVLLLAGCIAVNEARSLPQGQLAQCNTPGQVVFDGCNYCRCSAEGRLVYCTLKWCDPVKTSST